MPFSNPEKRKEYHRAYGKTYVENNRERHNERTRNNLAAARKANPEKFRELDKKRRPAGSVSMLLMKARARAKERGMEFSITEADFNIPETCPLLDIPLFGGRGKWCANSPTLDRVDNARGYVPGNVWVISWRANELKGNATVDELVKLATRLQLFTAMRKVFDVRVR